MTEIDVPAVPAPEVRSPAEAEIVGSLLPARDVPHFLKAENQYLMDATCTVDPLACRRILVPRSVAW